MCKKHLVYQWQHHRAPTTTLLWKISFFLAFVGQSTEIEITLSCPGQALVPFDRGERGELENKSLDPAYQRGNSG